MRRYENMVLLDGTLEPQDAKELVNKIVATVERFGGKIVKTENWGKRKCAYRIKKQSYAYYILLWFEAEAGIIDEMRRQYRLMEPVLRYIFVRPKRFVSLEAAASDGTEAKSESSAPEEKPDESLAGSSVAVSEEAEATDASNEAQE